jgi:hypothetical protein
MLALPEIRFQSGKTCTNTPIPNIPGDPAAMPRIIQQAKRRAIAASFVALVTDLTSPNRTNHDFTGKYPLQLKPNRQMATISYV